MFDTRASANLMLAEGTASQCILPEQFSGVSGKRTPEHKLALAVLEETFQIFMRHHDAVSRHGRRLFQEASEWFKSKDRSWPYSFENICDFLGLEPEYLRRGINTWEERMRSKSEGTRVQFRRVASSPKMRVRVY